MKALVLQRVISVLILQRNHEIAVMMEMLIQMVMSYEAIVYVHE